MDQQVDDVPRDDSCCSDLPIRVLQGVWNLGYCGGIQAWLTHVLRHVDRDRFHVDVLLLDDTRTGYYDEIEAMGCRILKLPPANILTHPRHLAELNARYGPYHTFHSHYGLTDGVTLRSARMVGIPVRIAHSRTTRIDEGARMTAMRRLRRRLARRWISASATHLLAVSRDAGQAMYGADVLQDPRFQVCHTAIDFGPFREPMPDSDSLRASMQIPENGLVVGHVGRFCHQKNQDFLVEIAAHLVQTRPDTYFVLVGDGPDMARIETRIADLGLAEHFRLTGSRDDVPALMTALFNVFVLPSREEGLGRVVVEAQAAGLPCVISNAVPTEADIVRPLLTRLDLAAGPREWATRTEICLREAPPVTPEGAIAAVEASPFSVLAAVRDLERMWSSFGEQQGVARFGG